VDSASSSATVPLQTATPHCPATVIRPFVFETINIFSGRRNPAGGNAIGNVFQFPAWQ